MCTRLDDTELTASMYDTNEATDFICLLFTFPIVHLFRGLIAL